MVPRFDPTRRWIELMMECSAATPSWDLLVWPEEGPQSSAHTAASVEAILRIARAETGAAGCILAVAKDRQVVCQKEVGSARSTQGRFLDSNAGILQECLRTRSIVVSGGIRSDRLVDPELCGSESFIGIVAVPLMHEAITAGCMLLLFAETRGFRDLQPGLKESLLHLAAAIALLLDRAQREKLAVRSGSQHSAPLACSFPGRLSELKSVLQSGSTSWEDIGQQLSSYLQTAFVVTTADCDEPGPNGGSDWIDKSDATKLAHS